MPKQTKTDESDFSGQITATRQLVAGLITRLEQLIKNPAEKPITETEIHAIWGEKETAVSLLVKLTGLLVKLAALEQDIIITNHKFKKTKTTRPRKPRDEADWEMIRRFVKREMGERVAPSR